MVDMKDSNCELRALDAIHSLGHLMLCIAQGSKCYKQLKVVAYMRYSGSRARGSRCYEQPRVMNVMNDSGSYELKPIDVMNCSEVSLT